MSQLIERTNESSIYICLLWCWVTIHIKWYSSMRGDIFSDGLWFSLYISGWPLYDSLLFVLRKNLASLKSHFAWTLELQLSCWIFAHLLVHCIVLKSIEGCIWIGFERNNNSKRNDRINLEISDGSTVMFEFACNRCIGC